MLNTAYISCYFELFQCFLMDSHTYDHLERQAHFNRAYIGQQLQVPSSLEWATNGKQLQRARKLQVIIWFLTLIHDSLVRTFNIRVREIESNRLLSIWGGGAVVWLIWGGGAVVWLIWGAVMWLIWGAVMWLIWGGSCVTNVDFFAVPMDLWPDMWLFYILFLLS